MRNHVLLLLFCACFWLVGCGSAVPRPEFQEANGPNATRLDVPDWLEPSLPIVRELEFRAVRPVSFAALPVCEAAAIVLGEALGVPYSCQEQAQIVVSLFYPRGTGLGLLDSFRQLVEGTGGEVRISDGVVGVYGGTQGAALLQENNQGLTGGDATSRLIISPPVDLPNLIEAASRVEQNIHVQPLPAGVSAQDAEIMAQELGFEVSIWVADGVTWIAASDAVLESALFGLLRESETASFLLPVVPVSQAALSQVLDAFPAVRVSETEDGLFLTGPRFELTRFVAVIRPLLEPLRDFRVSAAFLSFEQSRGRDLGVEVSGLAGAGSDLSVYLGEVGASLSAIVDASVESGQATVISRPSIMISGGTEGRFLAGSQVPIVSASTQDGVTLETVEYRDTGVSIIVSASQRGAFVILEVTVSLSQVGEIEGNGGNPVFQTQEYRGRVMLRPGQVAVISGLRDSTAANRRSLGLNLLTSRSQSERELQILLSVD